MSDETRKARRRRTARMMLARRDIRESTVIDDLVTLLEQVHTSEHAQDRDAIATIADRYGFQPWEPEHG